MGDSEGHRVALPAVLRPLLEEAAESYSDWREAQDDAFGDDAATGAEQAMRHSLKLFAAGATDAGMDPVSVATALRQKFPEAPLEGLFGTEVIGALPKRERPPRAQTVASARDSVILGTPLGKRYGDAYTVARTIIALGSTVKIIAYVIGGMLALSGVGIWLSGSSTVAGVGQGAFALGLIVGVMIFILGVLVTAVGQILRATLDTAVNTSPLLEKNDVAKIMSVD